MSNERTETITTLTEHLDHWKRLLSEGICTKDEGEKTINALEFAIESIKVDRAYDLAYEKVDFIEIPEGATNGEMIKAMFPNIPLGEDDFLVRKSRHKNTDYWKAWWDSPYRKENNKWMMLK